MSVVFRSDTGKPARRTDCVVCTPNETGSRPLVRGGLAMCSNPLGFRTTLLTSATLFLCSVFSLAQAGPKYDTSTEAKFKGTIEVLKMPPKDKDIAYLTIKSGTDTFDIYLCPKSFIDDMGVSFAKGDEIAFTGSKIKQGEAEMVLAREVVKGTDTLVLRDQKGAPVWNWNKH
jgi:hypothetical protein